MSDADLHQRGSQPAVIGATVALAWMVTVLAVLRVTEVYTLQQGAAGAVFFLGLAGGAGYFALALPRKIVSAWKACRELAGAIGTINLVILPSIAVGWAIAIACAVWAGAEAPPMYDTNTFASAIAATATPWIFYHGLGDDRVRGWFCVADCR